MQKKNFDSAKKILGPSNASFNFRLSTSAIFPLSYFLVVSLLLIWWQYFCLHFEQLRAAVMAQVAQ